MGFGTWASWAFAVGLSCAACASADDGDDGKDAGSAGQSGGGAGGVGGVAAHAGSQPQGQAGRTTQPRCGDSVIVRMPFPRLNSGAPYDMLRVSCAGGIHEVGISKGSAEAGWSHEYTPRFQLEGIEGRFDAELFQVENDALELRIELHLGEIRLPDPVRIQVSLVPAGTEDVHLLMNELVDIDRVGQRCVQLDFRAAPPEPLAGLAGAGGEGGTSGVEQSGGAAGAAP